MTPQTPDAFDTTLQQLFAGIVPDGGFEDRLVAALRPPRLRLVIPGPVAKAALAAAAMLAVGVTGYVGNQYILGGRELASRVKSASNLHQMGLAILLDEKDKSFEYGGGSNSAQDWSNLDRSHGIKEDKSPSIQNYFADHIPAATGKPGASPYDSLDSIALPSSGDDAGVSAASPAKPAPSTPSVDTPKPRMDFYYAATDGMNKGANGSVNLQGANTYTGKTAVTFGTIALGTTADRSRELSDQLGRSQTEVAEAKASADAANRQAGATNGSSEKKLPYDDILAYPPNWPKVSEMRDTEVPSGSKNAAADPNSPASGTGKANQSFVVLKDGTKVAVDQNGDPVKTGEQAARGSNDRMTIEGTLQLPAIVTANAAQNEHALATDPNPTPAVSSTQPAIIDDRKIIRTGTMEFDVDRFDTAQMQISKIVGELGGFVGATDSTKLPNGKVRGSIAVRIPPGQLDTLVLSLRALGDLKSQQITAADITKEYTDIESELAADRAMQDRLLDLIHNGKGAVKDLLAAENELGNWRTKIEKAEGMIRYYNAQVAMSTLTITLSEKDIQNPAAAVETQTADMGIESTDVESARTAAMKSIDEVKGRIISAELKRFDAGQLAAKLVADVPPESAGAVIDQLKLIGKVARLEIQRQQNTTDGSAAVTSVVPLRTERKPTRLLISIYNLANVAPRKTTNVNLAATDVEAAYTALASAAKSAGGRVVTSNLDRTDPVRTTGSLVLEFPPGQFESAMTTLRDQGEVLKLTATENPDTQNSTEAKQGLTVTLVSLASVPARESIQQKLAAVDVPKAYQAVLDAVNSAELTVHQGAVSVTATVPHSHGRVQSAQLNEQDRQNVTADLQLEIPRATEADFDKALAAAGVSISRTSTQAMNTDNAVDSKVQVHLSITSADHLPARESTKLQVEVPDVDKASGAAQTMTIADGGRVLESTINRDHGKGIARLVLDVPLEKAGEALQQLREAGTVRGIDSTRDPQAPTGQFAHAIIGVEFATGDAIVADQTGPWAAIRQGLSTSINGLLWSLQWIVVGLCLLGPWVLLTWGGLKLLRRRSRRATPAIS